MISDTIQQGEVVRYLSIAIIYLVDNAISLTRNLFVTHFYGSIHANEGKRA